MFFNRGKVSGERCVVVLDVLIATGTEDLEGWKAVSPIPS